MRIELQIDSEEFWPRLREDVLAARESVCVQTYSFEGDTAEKAWLSSFVSSNPWMPVSWSTPGPSSSSTIDFSMPL